MPQTLLAVAAIFCFALLALGRQQHTHDLSRSTMAMEAERAAVDVARARLTRVERLAFDEDDVNDESKGIRTTPSTLALGPDAGETGPDTFDDIDDWTGHDATEATPVGMGTLRFRTIVTVRYVQNLAPSQPSTSATLTKEIRVTTLEQPEGAMGRPPAQTSLRRVVTPASIEAQTLPE